MSTEARDLWIALRTASLPEAAIDAALSRAYAAGAEAMKAKCASRIEARATTEQITAERATSFRAAGPAAVRLTYAAHVLRDEAATLRLLPLWALAKAST